MTKRIYKKKKAAVSLITMLIISSLLLLSGIALIFNAIDIAKSDKDTYLGNLTYLRAQSCTDDTLYRIRKNLSLTGTLSITYTDGSCSSTVTNDSNPSYKDVALSATVSGYTYSKTFKVDITQSPFAIIK